MSHVVSRPTAPFRAGGGAATVHQVPAGTDNLVWVLVCDATGDAALVDGPDAEAALDYCAAHAIRVTSVLNTHTHGDHTGINRDLARRGMLGDLRVVGPARAAASVPGLTEPVDDGDAIAIGRLTGRVLLTEGHLDGHLSYLFGDVLFCGDALFTGGCGFLCDGRPEAMFRTLLRLAALPPTTLVCCAHEYTQDNLRFAFSVEPGNPALADRIRAVWAACRDGGCAVPSTIAEERATNPFLRPGSPEIVGRVCAAYPGTNPADPAAVFAATRALKDQKAYRNQVLDADLPLDG